MAGIDTALFKEGPDRDLIRLAAEEERLILTCDRKLTQDFPDAGALLLSCQDPEDQLAETVKALNLQPFFRPLSRCLVCNTLLVPIDKKGQFAWVYFVKKPLFLLDPKMSAFGILRRSETAIIKENNIEEAKLKF